MTEEAGRSEGLLDSLRNLARTFIAIVQTRIEIFASEIDEERTRLARIAVLAAVAALCIALSVILLVFFLVVLFWDTNRLVAIGAPADVSILELVEGPVDFVDTRKNARKGNRHLKPVATVRAGRPFGRPYPSPFSYP